jgi:hypothetical protein
MGLVLLAEEEEDRSDLSRKGSSLVEIMGPTGLTEPLEDILCVSLGPFREIC